ncbi:MAG: hypothetical protein IJK44_03145 [Bacteroidales bacterium]|jgi:hypothetical protein|nr:hypothetical protein [Bacteroidales bacterium]
MKKIYILLTALLAIFAVSCNKDDKKPQREKENKEENQEPEYEAPIKIDGDFSDWAKIDPSKMCIAECAPDSPWKGLTVMKVFMDEMYMFVYFEFVDASIPDKSDVQCHVYFDADNDKTTGGCNNQFDPGCIEYMGEGHIFRSDAFSSFDPSLSVWTGEPLVGGWEWEEQLPSGSGLFTGAGSGNAYEMAMLRALISDLGDVFGFGMDIQQAWASVGVLPNASIDDNNLTGKTSLLTISVK